MYKSDEINSRLPYAFGNELAWLRNASKDAQYAVMIGAGPAVMGMALMEGNPDLNLLIIDINTTEYARKHLDEAGFPLVGYAVSDSVGYGNKYAGPKLNFLLVDGDHSYAGVSNDIHAWFNHVKKGGLIFFHDYININDDPNNGTYDAVQEWFEKDDYRYKKQVEFVATPGISVVYRKLS